MNASSARLLQWIYFRFHLLKYVFENLARQTKGIEVRTAWICSWQFFFGNGMGLLAKSSWANFQSGKCEKHIVR